MAVRVRIVSGLPTGDDAIAFARLGLPRAAREYLHEKVAAATDELVRTVDLDATQPLPTAPWFPPNATRSARRVFVHIVGETAQHAGHADILRETLDGQKTMG